jgi:DNA-binding transcriptional LysR family regulator
MWFLFGAGMTDKFTSMSFLTITPRHLKLKPLLIFERVLNSPSIASAARDLNLSQSAVTKSIQELEAILDVPLFERTNRGIVPTCYGGLLGERIKTVISELRYLTDELNSFRSGETGHVIVGSLISASAQLLPKAIIKLKQQRPGILITVREGPNDQLFQALANGEVDIVVGRLPSGNLPLLHQLPFKHAVLYPDEMCVVAGQGHPIAQRKNLRLPDLLEYPWIFPLQESPARLLVDQLFQDAGIALPKNITESLSLLTNIGLLQDSSTIVLMPRAVAQHFVHLGVLSILDLGNVGKFGNVGYSTRADRIPAPAAQFFIECLIQSK